MTSATIMQETLINGKWKLYLPEHRAVRPEWITGWEPERLDSICKNIEPGEVVYDIGTEEGDLSALYQLWVGKDGGVCLFEPNPRVWSNIRAIWEGNNLPKPYGMWPGFAADVNAHLAAHDPREWPDSSLGPLISDHGFCNVCERPDLPSVKLDDFMTSIGESPDIVTIDVEGAELLVLMGMQTILAEVRPIVYVSIHPDFMRQMYDMGPNDLHEFMGAYGYRTKWLATDHEEHWVFWHPYGKELKL